MDKESKDYKEAVDRVFNSGNVPEWQLRAMSVYTILKDRIYTDILPKIFALIDESEKGRVLNGEEKAAIWGKLVACSIRIMIHNVLEHYKNTPKIADEFNKAVFAIFLKDFDENIRVLMEYDREDTAMGEGQIVWALGKTVCDVLNVENAFLAMNVCSFFEEIHKIELNTTYPLLTIPLGEVKAMVKSIAIQHPIECWL